jgi:hypothetical protein
MESDRTQDMHVGVLAGLTPTCMAAQRVSLGMVLINPNSDRSRKRRPGANRSTFIFTDTAKLSERDGERSTLFMIDFKDGNKSIIISKTI